MPASIAASQSVNVFALLPNQPPAADSMPMKFAPNGARFKYCVIIHSLSFSRSIFSARNASSHFWKYVFLCGLMRRTVCIVIVDAPDILRLLVTFCQTARAMLESLTPQ